MELPAQSGAEVVAAVRVEDQHEHEHEQEQEGDAGLRPPGPRSDASGGAAAAMPRNLTVADVLRESIRLQQKNERLRRQLEQMGHHTECEAVAVPDGEEEGGARKRGGEAPAAQGLCCCHHMCVMPCIAQGGWVVSGWWAVSGPPACLLTTNAPGCQARAPLQRLLAPYTCLACHPQAAFLTHCQDLAGGQTSSLTRRTSISIRMGSSQKHSSQAGSHRCFSCNRHHQWQQQVLQLAVLV